MKWILFAVIVLLVAITLLGRSSEPVLAQSPGPTMEVSVGFDGYCRAGDGYWCPVSVILSNEDANVEGVLRVMVDGAAGVDSSAYLKPVVLPSRSRKAYTLYVSSASSSYRSRLLVELLVGSGQNQRIVAQQAEVVWLDDKERLWGVISSRPSALNFLSDLASVSVASMDLETLPENPLGWEGLTVLVLNDVDTSALTRDQRRALAVWVSQGGHLLVGGGAGAVRTDAAVADLLPVSLGGSRSVDSLWALGEWVGAPSEDGPYAVAEASLRDGDVIVGQDDLLLIASRVHGAGKVTWLAFDAALRLFSEWDDNLLMWDLMVGVWGVQSTQFTVQNGYNLRSAINAIPGLELPSTLQLLAFMLLYTILVGPVNYLVLRKMDRRELAWLTIPVLILGFSACAYLTGFQVRGAKAIVHRLAVAYVPEESGVARVRQMVGVFSPRRTTYDVSVADVGVREIQMNYYGGPDRQALRVVEEANRATITDLRVDVGGIQPFFTEGYVETSPVDSDLKVDTTTSGDLRVSGTLRIGDTPLEGAAIISGNYEQRLGDLEAGQEVNVLISYSGASATGYKQFPVLILGPGSYWDDPKLYRRQQFLQAFTPYDGAGTTLLRNGVYLVGWVEDAPLTVEVVDRPFSTLGTTLYVYALPVTGIGSGVKVNIPPGLISCGVENSSASLHTWSAGGVGHMEPDTEVELWCPIWKGVQISQVDKLQLQWRGHSYGVLPADAPEISLWNQKTETWRKLSISWGTHIVPAGESFVLPEGGIRVRLVSSAEQSVNVEQLSFSIEGRR